MKTVLSRIPKCAQHKDFAISLPLRFYVKLILVSHILPFFKTVTRRTYLSLVKISSNLQNDLTEKTISRNFSRIRVCNTVHSLEKGKIYSHRKIFHQYTYLVKSKLNMYLCCFHGIFSQKVWEWISVTFYCSTVWKLQKFSFIVFSQKFRESNGFT